MEVLSGVGLLLRGLGVIPVSGSLIRMGVELGFWRGLQHGLGLEACLLFCPGRGLGAGLGFMGGAGLREVIFGFELLDDIVGEVVSGFFLFWCGVDFD